MKFFVRVSRNGSFVPLETYEISEKFHAELIKTIQDQIARKKARLV